MINAYLSSSTDLDDASIHLLFSANRWEKKCAEHSVVHRSCARVQAMLSHAGYDLKRDIQRTGSKRQFLETEQMDQIDGAVVQGMLQMVHFKDLNLRL